MRILFIILLAFALSGCTLGAEKKIKIFQVEEPRANLNLESPEPLDLEKLRKLI